jgi:hypothetical protein
MTVCGVYAVCAQGAIDTVVRSSSGAIMPCVIVEVAVPILHSRHVAALVPWVSDRRFDGWRSRRISGTERVTPHASSRVLLADDHALLLGAFEKLLAAECEIVGQASDGRALVAAAES